MTAAAALFDGPAGLWGVPAAQLFTALATVGTGLWLLTYVLIIRQGWKDATYGMPIAAFCANFSNELIFSFVHPPDGSLRYSNYLWLTLDVLIGVQIMLRAPQELRSIGAVSVRTLVGGGLVAAWAFQLLFIREFGDTGGAYTIFGINVLMSFAFVQMAIQRGDRRGQSVAIGWAKLCGTGSFSLAMVLFSWDAFARGPFLVLLYVLCLVLDVYYVVLVSRLPRCGAAPGSGPAPVVQRSGHERRVPPALGGQEPRLEP